MNNSKHLRISQKVNSGTSKAHLHRNYSTDVIANNGNKLHFRSSLDIEPNFEKPIYFENCFVENPDGNSRLYLIYSTGTLSYDQNMKRLNHLYEDYFDKHHNEPNSPKVTKVNENKTSILLHPR